MATVQLTDKIPGQLDPEMLQLYADIVAGAPTSKHMEYFESVGQLVRFVLVNGTAVGFGFVEAGGSNFSIFMAEDYQGRATARRPLRPS